MFRSLRDAAVVVLTVPLALAGGVLGIRALGLVAFQPLDLLTMIGFIMMIGIIVNHSILLVDRTRDALNHGHGLEEALRMALNRRLRAMVASTLTGALGALPPRSGASAVLRLRKRLTLPARETRHSLPIRRETCRYEPR